MTAKKPATDLESIGMPEALGEEFREHWLFHLQSRKDWGHKRYTAVGAARKLTSWTKYHIQAVIDAINESAEQGWQGVFPEKHQAKYRNHASTGGMQIDAWLKAHRSAEPQPTAQEIRRIGHDD